MHRRFIVALLVLLSICTSAFSQISLSIEESIANVAPDGKGYCAWACIETLGRHLGIKSLYGLKDRRTKESDFKTWDDINKKWIIEPYVWVDYGGRKVKVQRNLGDYVAMKQKLDEANVKYQIQETGIFKTEIIRYAIKSKLGCMIVVKNWYGTSSTEPHAVCIQDYDNDKLVLFDPNNININFHVSWQWLGEHWTGYVLVIEGTK